MTSSPDHKAGRLLKWLVAGMTLVLASVGLAAAESAEALIEAPDLRGGLAVVLGCDDLTLLSGFAGRDFVVQGLDRNRETVTRARASLVSAGVYGNTTVAEFDGHTLPHVDNLVNLVIVASDRCAVSSDEIARVLAPRGVVLARHGSPTGSASLSTAACGLQGWTKRVKPWPAEIDHWPMHMYEPGNNAVSKDMAVGPPRHLQWRSGPTWTRSHEFASSLNAMVSMNGKLFYVMDEGSRLSPMLPAKWTLVCRDAFNGIVLWKRSLPTWHTQWWPVKSGPTQAMRRLVAVDDKLYLPLGAGAPLSELDARTGKTLRTFEGTDGVEEIRISDGVIYLVTSDSVAEQQTWNLTNVEVWGAAGDATGQFKWDNRKRQISAIDRKSGKLQWKKEHPIMTLTLALDGKQLYFHNGTKVVALSRVTGEPAWTSEDLEPKQYKLGTATTPSLLAHDDVVICTQGFDFQEGVMLALSAQTGQTLWRETHPSSGHSSPDDIHIVDGLVWDAGIARIQKQGGTYRGRDLRTGEVKREFPLDAEHNAWFHQRCYRSRATEKFIMPAATGVEYVDVRNEHWETNHWVRGACLYGVLPANGLTYATPHPCACFMESMVRGFSALASQRSVKGEVRGEKKRRLEKGPAYETLHPSPLTPHTSNDWPMYRHDPARSGYSKTSVDADLQEAWTVDLGDRITPPVAAGGMVFVAAVDHCTIHALDETRGRRLWTFTTGARIDSPPTFYQGRLIFGSADGWLYCLDSKSGQLAWRFRGAPGQRMMINDGRIESAWPVHGSVLIENDTIYCLAGRSLFLDGGMHLSLLNPKTGELIAGHLYSDMDPESGKSMQFANQGLKMVPSNSDLLVSDGNHLYLKTQKIALDGKRIFPERGSKLFSLNTADQGGEGTHLLSPPGFLDTAWHHRSYWLYGKAAGSGWGGWMKPGKYVPAGKILVIDEKDNVFGFGREPAFFAQSHVLEYQLFSARGNVYERDEWKKVFAHQKSKEASITNWKQNRALPIEKLSAVRFNWRKVNPPVLVRAMVGANDTLFVAGPPDVLDETRLYGRLLQPDATEDIEQQQAALDGKLGAVLWAVSCADGRKLAELRLDSLPVFDGMAAAHGKLYISTMDGKLMCYE